ncbi:hypothetical protein PZBJ_20145 [Pantoea endophytica]|uniref:Eaa protein n=1 Tax=Pantoea endophytica TaxID=92488 RepID=A0ABX4SL04_9GAMM|nr:hypothetical protein [Pantoea endophytica]PLR20366.1 hypothetical protein PZBJ_20145 [Pantoea endophytica]
MTNQQLKAHCEDVIANPQDHSEMVLAMAKALLPCLEAKPVFFVEIEGDDWTNSGRIEGDERPDLGLLPEGINHLYVVPPVTELKPIELGAVTYCEDGKPWFTADEVISAIRAAGCEVKS